MIRYTPSNFRQALYGINSIERLGAIKTVFRFDAPMADPLFNEMLHYNKSYHKSKAKNGHFQECFSCSKMNMWEVKCRDSIQPNAGDLGT